MFKAYTMDPNTVIGRCHCIQKAGPLSASRLGLGRAEVLFQSHGTGMSLM
jgi:hypothetical protein